MTPKQTRFVEEYLVDLNATQAAIRAGYSVNTAKEIGYENLTKPHIRAKVDERLLDLSMSAAEVTKRIADIARGDVADVVEILPGGSWRIDLKKAVRLGKTWLIHELAFDRQGNPKVKLYSAHEALRDLARVHGLFNDKLVLSGDLPELVVRNESE
jgi:phage terminase small subunit